MQAARCRGVRIWDVDPRILCRQHLLSEHRELHGLWNILTQDKRGYRNHPETQRWVGRLPALRQRHEELAAEMERRGFRHVSPLPEGVDGLAVQDRFLESPGKQVALLRAKDCPCPLETGK